MELNLKTIELIGVICRVYEKIIALTKCDVYSVRATALNVLGLVGSTNAGANVLYKLGKLN